MEVIRLPPLRAGEIIDGRFMLASSSRVGALRCEFLVSLQQRALDERARRAQPSSDTRTPSNFAAARRPGDRALRRRLRADLLDVGIGLFDPTPPDLGGDLAPAELSARAFRSLSPQDVDVVSGAITI